MKTLMVTAVLLLVGLATAQRFSTTPKYFAPPAGGPNVNINDPNVNINDPNVNINHPNYAQPGIPIGAGDAGGGFSSFNPNGGGYYGGVHTQVPALGVGGQSNSAETANGGSQVAIDDTGYDADANGSELNIDGTDGDSDASMAKGVNTTALGVVLTIVIVLGIFGVVAVILIRQRRQNSS